MRRGAAPVVAAIALAYVLLRALLVWRLPPFFDEGYYAAQVGAARADFAHHALIGVTADKGPLQTWLALPLVVAGIKSLTALRLISTAAGAVTAVFTGLIAYELLDSRRQATAAAALMALFPLTVLNDAMGLADGLAAASFAAAVWLQLRLARRPGLRTAAALALVVAAGGFVKETALLSLGVLPFAFVLMLGHGAGDRGPERAGDRGPERAGDRSPERARAFGLAALATVLVAVATVAAVRALSPYPASELARDTAQHSRSVGAAITTLPQYLESSATAVGDAMAGYFGIPLVVFVLFAGLGLEKQRARRGLFALMVALIPILATLALTRAAYPRYLLPAAPGMSVLTVAGVAAVATHLPRPRRPLLLALTTAVLAGWPAYTAARILTHPGSARYPGGDRAQLVTGWPAGTGLERIGGTLVHAAPPGRVVVATDHDPPYGLGAQLGNPVLRGPFWKIPYNQSFEVHVGRTLLVFDSDPREPERARARFALIIDDRKPFAAPPGRPFHVLATFQRAGLDGVLVRLLERGPGRPGAAPARG